jgi:general secretion pathway protein C
MDLRYSERYLMALNALLIAAMAYFAALCVNDIITARLHPFVAASSLTPTRPARPAIVYPRAHYEAIARRDIFNLEPPPAKVEPQPTPARDLHIKLLGTSLISVGKPFAIVEDTRTGQQLLYRVGETIPDTGRLVQVKRDSVIIDQDGQLVTVTMESTPLTPGTSGPGPGRSRRFRLRGNAVRRLGSNHYMLQRTDVNKHLENLAQLFTQIRAVPNMVGGHADGYVLSNIQPDSIFQQIGLHDGDILMSVNGQEVRDPTQAMQLFTQLRSAESLTLQVLREGAPVQMHYTIH